MPPPPLFYFLELAGRSIFRKTKLTVVPPGPRMNENLCRPGVCVVQATARLTHAHPRRREENHGRDPVGRMVKECCHRGCVKRPSYGAYGSTRAEFCAQHAKDGMIDVRSKRCGHRGCITRPSYGVNGTTKAQFCARHAEEGMVNVRSKRCGHEGCTTRPSYGVHGTKKVCRAGGRARARWRG